MARKQQKERMGIENGEVFGLQNIYKMLGYNLNDREPDRPWIPEGDNYLIELYLQGWTIPEIANEMKRSAGNVVGRIYYWGEKGRLSMDIWGSKAPPGKVLPKGLFRLFGID